MEPLHFLRPLWLLSLLPLAGVWAWLWRQRTQGGQWHRLGDPRLLSHLLQGGATLPSRAPLFLLAAGWMLAVIALAGPTWEQEIQPVFKPRKPLVIALDLSASMNTADLPPSRLERAKQKTRDAMARGEQVGLVAFAGDAFAVIPLTEDANTLAALLPALTPRIMPVQGSRPGLAMEEAAKLLAQAGPDPGVVLLITDGDAQPSTSLATARTLAARGDRLAVLGVGTPQGAPIPLQEGGFVQDRQGNPIMATLDIPLLEALAAAAGGKYATITHDDADLDHLLVWPAGGGETLSRHTAPRWREMGPWLLLPLLAVAVLAFRRGWLTTVALLCFLLPQPARAFSWADLWQRPDQQGVQTLNNGQPEQAAELFQDPAWQGTALYKSEKFADAATSFGHVTTADGHYNRGTALARAGQLPEAVAAFQQALQQDPNHEDARHNLEVVEKALAAQPPPPPQNKESDPSQSQEKDQKQPPDPAQESEKGQEKESDKEQEKDQKKDQDKGQEEEHSTPSPTPEGKEEPPKPSPPQGQESQPQEAQAAASEEKETPEEREARQSMEQWLRRIPDDPGGLLRRKFLLEHQRRGGNKNGEESW